MSGIARLTLLRTYLGLAGTSLILAGLSGSSLGAVLLWSLLVLLLINWMSKGSLVSWGILLALDLLAVVAPFAVLAEGTVLSVGVVGQIAINLLQVGILMLLVSTQKASQRQPSSRRP